MKSVLVLGICKKIQSGDVVQLTLCWGELGQMGRQGGVSVLRAAGTEEEG